MTESSYIVQPGGNGVDDRTIKRKIALALMQQGSDFSPVQHWTQGLARMAQGALGGYEMYQAGQDEKRETAEANQNLLNLYDRTNPGSGSSSPFKPAVAPSGQGGDAASAIASIESGGRYDAMGPVTRTGDRAHGKYQVMGANIGPWSQAALGRPVTPQEFLADPKIQDAVFQHRFGQYSDKYGPVGAAKAWFAGEGGMNNPNAKDQLGTTVSAYADKFARALGAPVQQAQFSPSPAATPSGATPGGINRDAIVQMLNNRQTAPIARNIISQQIGQQLKPETTDEIKEYNLYTRQERAAGREPKPFFEYKSELKRAGAIQNNVQIDQKAETAFRTKAGQVQAERFDKLVQGGLEAQGIVADLNALKEIGGRITTGKVAEIQAALGPYAEAAGIKMDGLDDLQAYKSIVAKLAPRMRVAGSGATSDFEMRQFLEALPGLGKTPGGNEIIANTMQAISQHRIEAADIGSKALAGEITPREAEKALRELPDPLSLWKEKGKTLKDDGGWKDMGNGVRIREKK